MVNFVSVRISNKFNTRGEVTHDLHNSHNRKINDKPNYLIDENSAFSFYRDTDDKYDVNYILESHKTIIDNAKKDYKEHHPRAMKSNTNIEYAGIITFGNDDKLLSRAEMNALDQDILNKNAFDFLNNFVENNGIDKNSIYLVKHNDESQIHYHFKFIAYDFEKHKVMRSRMDSKFLSELQDSVGRSFEKSGFSRGVKKSDRITQVLYEKDITNEEYKMMSKEDKYEILKEANVKNKPPRQQHAELKNDIYKLQQNVEKAMSLFDRVEKMTPYEINELKESMDTEDKLVKRFFTYALRLHNLTADKAKAIKNLESTIKELGHQKEDIEAEFQRYYQQRYQTVEQVSFKDLEIDQAQIQINKTALLNKVLVDKKALDDLSEYAQRMQDGYKHYVDKYNSIAILVEPLKDYIPEFKDLVLLKDETDDMKIKLSFLKTDVKGYERRVDKITATLLELQKKALELQKNPSHRGLEREIKSSARGLEIGVMGTQKTIEEDGMRFG